jgi:glycosyltransferase involved in cell wall biosynthesis
MSRGLEQAIEALRYWPELHLALIGPEHAPTVRRLRRLVSRFMLEPRVHFVPPVASEHVTSYVASADVGIVPIQNACLSYYYSLPNKLLESTFARLPLAVSDFPEFRRFLRLSESGIVMDERSPKDIARAVREVYLRQREFRADAETLRKVEAVYGWPRQKEVLMHLYRSLRVACEERTPRRID